MQAKLLHVVSLSGGLSSAIAADRVIDRFGYDVVLWFADTLWEDEDLYRFLADLETRWGKAIIRASDGRTPLEVAEDHHVIPNSLMAPCSDDLKSRLCRKYLVSLPKPVTLHLGMDWHEGRRVDRARVRYSDLEGVTVDFPLLWKPLEFRPSANVVRSWGIAIPRLYQLGMPHNNCGGRCVRQGIGEWRRLYHAFPERYLQVEEWEQAQQAKGGPRNDRSILKERRGAETFPLTLRELRERIQGGPEEQLPMIDDRSACFCEA